ncbi:MAG: hypothetical protein ACREP1_09820, partial [Rhodanobacteraceae bacterium]
MTPFRSAAYLLRSKLLSRDISLLGVEFLSPAQLREKLLSGNRNLPLREHLRLLLATAAGKIATSAPNSEEVLVAKSIERDPDHFLRVIDQLGAAGWSPDEIDEPGLRTVAKAFEKIVHHCDFQFVHEADRDATGTLAKAPPVFHWLLLLGFNGAHWPLWPLLHAAATAATEATVCLSDPRDEARDLDETWIGTWEETFGAAQPIAAADAEAVSLLENLNRLPETPAEKATRAAHPIEAIHFLVGRDTPEQAKAIVALTAKFLQDENCERVGILFPRSGALPRTVARLLEANEIAHNDGLAHFGPSAFDDDAWRAWLELQQSPRLKILLRFLRATSAKIFEKLPVREVEDVLRRAYGEVLIDNLGVLHEYCARQKDSERHDAVVRGLEKIQF